MRLLRLALCAACLPLAGLRAADEEQQKQQPEEIPDFNRIDEYTYVPKSTLSLASRYFINGPKVSYSGQGAIAAPVFAGNDPLVPNVSRTYYDGVVNPDARAISTTTGIGANQSVPIAPDGKTNTWAYDFASQVLPSGDIAFNVYSGEVTDTGLHSANGAANLGVELLMDRDMGKIGKRLKWAITAGFSIADIHSSTYANVPTTLQTITDTYDLFGQVPPTPPYHSPNNNSQTVLNSSGQASTGAGGATATQTVDQTTLLGNVPLNRTTSDTPGLSTNRYFVEGAYYTLRIGPTLIMPIGSHFKFTVSAGPDLIYAGSELNVFEDLPIEEDTSQPITVLYQKENTRILPGYYLEADLRYDLTESAGFYLGNLYQGGGGYSQTAPSGTSGSTELGYTTKINFASQDGVKGGFTFRF